MHVMGRFSLPKLLGLLIVGFSLLQLFRLQFVFLPKNHSYDSAPFGEFYQHNRHLYDVPSTIGAVSNSIERFDQSMQGSARVKNLFPKVCIGISNSPTRKECYLYRTVVSLLESSRAEGPSTPMAEVHITVFNTAAPGVPNPVSAALQSTANVTWFNIVNVASQMQVLLKTRAMATNGHLNKTLNNFRKTYCHTVAYRFMLEHMALVHSEQQCDALVLAEDDVSFSRGFAQRVLDTVTVLQQHDGDWLWLKLFAPTSAYLSLFGWDPTEVGDLSVMVAVVVSIGILLVSVHMMVRTAVLGRIGRLPIRLSKGHDPPAPKSKGKTRDTALSQGLLVLTLAACAVVVIVAVAVTTTAHACSFSLPLRYQSPPQLLVLLIDAARQLWLSVRNVLANFESSVGKVG
jgi:hypothetical protein